MKRRNISLFLGAGASKAFNYPLTKEILGLIIKEIKEQTLFIENGIDKNEAKLYQSLIQELLINLSPGLKIIFIGNTTINENNLPLITDLLSQAENLYNNNFALTDFNFGSRNSLIDQIKGINERWDLKDVITLLEWAIITAINKDGSNASNKLGSFIKWVRKVNQSKGAFVSIITSNYDFSVEWNLLESSEALKAHELIDYGFNWRDVEDGEVYLRIPKPQLRIFKLHGSTDWLRCNRCGFIYVNSTANIFSLAFKNKKTSLNTCHCNYWPLAPVLVTPSFSRTMKDTNLSQIWRNTLEQLRNADEWIIVGYSLPGEDLDIKSLFIRALIGRSKPPVIKVIQQSTNSKAKYDFFFGVGNYEFIDGGFENYNFDKINIDSK